MGQNSFLSLGTCQLGDYLILRSICEHLHFDIFQQFTVKHFGISITVYSTLPTCLSHIVTFLVYILSGQFYCYGLPYSSPHFMYLLHY